MRAIELAKNVWILVVGALVGLVVIGLLVGAMLGGSLKDSCPGIEWQGQQCQALKRVEWAKRNGLAPNLVEGYYSLPEDER